MSRPEARVLQLCHGYDGPYYRWSRWLFVDRIAPLRHYDMMLELGMLVGNGVSRIPR